MTGRINSTGRRQPMQEIRREREELQADIDSLTTAINELKEKADGLNGKELSDTNRQIGRLMKKRNDLVGKLQP